MSVVIGTYNLAIEQRRASYPQYFLYSWYFRLASFIHILAKGML